MKFYKKIVIPVSVIIFFLVSFLIYKSAITRPSFYIATDKSFGTKDVPYINLEGPGYKRYEFRVYKVTDPLKFIRKSVKERLVKEQNDIAQGNPLAILKESWQFFKKDFRKIARREFNYRTRSSLKESTGVDLNSPSESVNVAMPGILKDHTYLFSFSIPASTGDWVYKRVPVPVAENGFYLIEAVQGSNLGYTLVVKSNINFVTKQSDMETLVYAGNRDTGEAIENAEVVLLDGYDGKQLYKGQTSSNGTLEVKKRTLDKTLVVVRKGEEYAISDPNFYARSFYGSGGYRAFLYTDRPIYKPGDDVSFKGIIRQYKGDRYRLTAGNATVSVLDGKGDTVLDEVPVKISTGNGTFNGSFKLPKHRKVYIGVYNLVLNYKEKAFSTEFSVEAYKKPEFFVKVKTSKKSYVGEESVPIAIEAKYYYGEPVTDAKIRYRIFRKKKFDFSPVGQLPYYDLDPAYLGMDGANVKRELVLEKETSLDSDGLLKFTLDPENIDDDYTYSVIASVKAMDSTINGSASFSVNRSEFFIKIIKESTVYEPGDTVKMTAWLKNFDAGLSGKELAKVIASRKIEAILYNRKFHSISQESKREKISAKSISTDKNGQAVFNFKLPGKGHYIVVFKASDRNSKETEANTTIWASAKSDSIQVPFKNITLKSKKDIYSTGEYAEILIMTPAADGSMLVTLEGNRIFKHETVKLKGNTYKYRVKISENMSPNFTFSVLQFAGNDVYQNQIKIVAPPQDKFINVKVFTAKKIYKPGEKATLYINTKSLNKSAVSAEVSIAVVDEAVFAIQPDKNPPIATYFYHPRRNNVNTTLSTAYRFFGYSEAKRLQLALNRKINSPLTAIKDGESSRERFEDTCYWQAVVKTDSRGKAKITFPLAENLTTWRVTAIAVTRDTKVGQGKTRFIARKKLMVKPAIPSYLVKGEKQKISANVTNLTKKSLQTSINIKTENVKVLDKKTYQINIGPGETKQVYYTIMPLKDMTDKTCMIDIQARGGKFFDGSKQQIPVMDFGIPRVVSASVKLTDNDTKKIDLDIPGKYQNPVLKIRLSLGSGEALRQALSYLVNYPYGCIEQTMSSFMPLLAAKNAGYINSKIHRELPEMVSAGLTSIASHQKPDGGFGWYTEKRSNSLMSAYVYYGLALCKKLYRVQNKKLLIDTRKFLYKYLARQNPAPFERAFILHALSEGGKLERSLLNKLLATTEKQTPYGKALTAKILYNNHDQNKAKEIFKDALDKSGLEGEDDLVFKNRTNGWDKDQVETAAMLLSAAVKLKMEDKIINNLASVLILNRQGNAWKNSRDTALAVIALSEQLTYLQNRVEESHIVVKCNNKKVKDFTASARDIENNALIKLKSAFLKSDNQVEIEKTGGIPLYATLVIEYVDNSDSFDLVNNGFEIKRTYYRMQGEQDSSGKYSFDADKSSSFNAGDLVMVKLEVNVKKVNDPYYIIENPVPPGFSVVRDDEDYFSTRYPKEYFAKQIFYDRTAFFFSGNRGSSGNLIIRYFIRADIPGKYRVLPAQGSLMYYPEVNGHSEDDEITVK